VVGLQRRIVLEGDNQKQADFLSRSPVKADAKKLHDIEVIAWSFQIRAAEDFVKSIQTSQKLNCEVQEILRQLRLHYYAVRFDGLDVHAVTNGKMEAFHVAFEVSDNLVPRKKSIRGVAWTLRSRQAGLPVRSVQCERIPNDGSAIRLQWRAPVRIPHALVLLVSSSS